MQPKTFNHKEFRKTLALQNFLLIGAIKRESLSNALHKG